MRQKEIIDVPGHIRYLSDWPEFHLPDEPTILDKALTGCGFTQWALKNEENVILCSPRKLLLENKYLSKDHFNECHLVQNGSEIELDFDTGILERNLDSRTPSEKEAAEAYKEIQDIDLFMSKLEKSAEESEISNSSKIKSKIADYLEERRQVGAPAKILVTYDSFRYVKGLLMDLGILQDFRVIVDEFQSVLMDSIFKSEVEFKFLNLLSDMDRVTYASATPLMESALNKLSFFDDVKYVVLDWESLNPGRIIKPYIKTRNRRPVSTVIDEIVKGYLEGDFDRVPYKKEDGSIGVKESMEVVFYVNSVRSIYQAINRNNLKPSQVNIICANTPENVLNLKKKLKIKGHSIGRVPQRDEPNKMFTFCTRTAYLGADFYSDNARTVVLCNPKVNALAVDISLDLPQILGRQRNDNNPWKYRAEFFYSYNTTDKNKKDEILEHLENKKQLTKGIIQAFYEAKSENAIVGISSLVKDNCKAYRNASNYAAVVETEGKTEVVTNICAEVADEWAYNVQMVDYQDRATLFNSMDAINGTDNPFSNMSPELAQLTIESVELTDRIASVGAFEDKLKMLCEESLIMNPVSFELAINTGLRGEPIIPYFETLGPEKCKSVSYKKVDLDKELKNLSRLSNPLLRDDILNTFKVGDRITLAEVRDMLGDLYKQHNVKKRAIAKDIEDWFEVKRTKEASPIDQRRVDAVEIIAIK